MLKVWCSNFIRPIFNFKIYKEKQMNRAFKYYPANLWGALMLALGILSGLFPSTAEAWPGSAAPVVTRAASMPGIAPSEFFGVVGRDPWYEWNTNPRYNGANLEFLENMARELHGMGARYIRIEFRADQMAGVRGGFVNFAKYDAFVNDIAPRYGLKVLGLLGYALVNWTGPGDRDLHFAHFNDLPDQANGSNPLIRFFATRAADVIAHYGDKVAAWEVLNEINYWDGVSLRPDSMGALMVFVYGMGKTANPNAQIIVGAQLAPQPPQAEIDSFIYLTAFFRSATVQEYVRKPKPDLFKDNPFPWDGMAWHPYHANLNDAIASVRRMIDMLRSWGDTKNKIWITEVGRPANLRGASECGLGAEESSQARYLTDFYTQLITFHMNDIAAVFWFKYEDFYDRDTGQVAAYGLVRLEGDGRGNYAPGGRVTAYKAAYYAYQRLAGPESPADPQPPPLLQRSSQNPAAPWYFNETGHTLNGAFLDYWLQHGGLDLFGFPLTEPFEEVSATDGKRYLVQYFQRERFEYHPENRGTPFEVLLGLLTVDLLRLDCRGFGAAPPPGGPLPGDRAYFQPTGHNLAGRFKQYWDRRGGLAVYGYPVSEEFAETSPIDGKSYTVQYFERARFEYHPDAPPDYQVQLALLGTEVLRRRGWLS
jgi:hypothetical protein